MVEGFYRQVAKAIAKAGFVRVPGGKGSHEKWRHPETGRLLVVPRHMYSRRTANGVLRSAGLSQRV